MTAGEIRDEMQRIAMVEDVLERGIDLEALRQRVTSGSDRIMTKATFDQVMSQTLRAAAELQVDPGQQDALQEMHDNYFIMASEAKVKVGSWTEGNVNGHVYRQMNMHSVPDFKTLTGNQFVGDTNLADMWLRSANRRMFTGMICNPLLPEEHNGKLNTWQGFSVVGQPYQGDAPKGPVRLFVEHILRISGQNKKLADYIIKWLAWGVQYPNIRIGTVIVLIGEQGTGKGTLGNFIRSLWGFHGHRIASTEELVGKHNAHLANKGFLFVDEPPFSGNKGIADYFKALITEPTFSIEPKFQDRFEVDNMLKMICATNHHHAVRVEFSDRRFMVQHVPSKMRTLPTEYWKRWNAIVDTKEGKAAVLHYLEGVDTTGWSAERDRPATAAYQEQKAMSATGDQRWWATIIDSETFQIGKSHILEPDTDILQNGGRLMLKSGVYKMYYDWHIQTQRGEPVPAQRFWQDAYKMGLVEKRQIKRGPSGNQRYFVEILSFVELGERMALFLLDGKGIHG